VRLRDCGSHLGDTGAGCSGKCAPGRFGGAAQVQSMCAGACPKRAAVGRRRLVGGQQVQRALRRRPIQRRPPWQRGVQGASGGQAADGGRWRRVRAVPLRQVRGRSAGWRRGRRGRSAAAAAPLCTGRAACSPTKAPTAGIDAAGDSDNGHLEAVQAAGEGREQGEQRRMDAAVHGLAERPCGSGAGAAGGKGRRREQDGRR
jgi:hypothetical protein